MLSERQLNCISFYAFRKRGKAWFLSLENTWAWIIYEDGTERLIHNDWYSEEDIMLL